MLTFPRCLKPFFEHIAWPCLASTVIQNEDLNAFAKEMQRPFHCEQIRRKNGKRRILTAQVVRARLAVSAGSPAFKGRLIVRLSRHVVTHEHVAVLGVTGRVPAPYSTGCVPDNLQTVVTSVVNTSATWLPRELSHPLSLPR